MRARRLAPMVGLTLVAYAGAARAQQSFAIDQLEPAPAGDVFVGVPSPYARGDLVPRVVAMFEYARDPLRLVQTTGTTNVVDSQAFVDVNASFTVQDRLLVSALLPIAVAQHGQGASVSGQPLAPPDEAAIGDLRLGLRVRMIGADDGPIQAGVGAYLHLPTGKSGGFVGEGTVREVPHGAVGGRFLAGVPFLWTASVGVLVRDSSNPSTLTYGAGLAAALLAERLRLGVEVYASTPLEDGTYALSSTVNVPDRSATNAELLASANGRVIGGLVVGVAGGPGLTDAPGTPAMRLVGTLGWSPEPGAKLDTPGDTDGDGISNADDACPYAFGPRSADPKKNGCPIVDDDEDGIPNDEDACPDKYGPRTADRKTNGCPKAGPIDTDGDGIPDKDDACPSEPGSPSQDPKRNGCPAALDEPDADGDGIPDKDDACPRDRGPKTSDPATNGCPAHVRVGDAEITLVAPLAWARGPKVAIDPASDVALEEVAAALAQHAEITRVEVRASGGGPPALAKMAGTQRAEAIRAWLVAHGVDGARVVAVGVTPGLRADAGRVTFAIVKR
jgi:hypothetical protein